MTQPEHDFDDPLGYLNAIDAVMLSVRAPRCPHCNDARHMLPMVGDGWGVEIFHEQSCPMHEDNRPAAEFR